MKCLKLILFFAVISFGAVSCSMGGGHTKCAAYTYNESDDNSLEDINDADLKDYKEAELVY